MMGVVKTAFVYSMSGYTGYGVVLGAKKINLNHSGVLMTLLTKGDVLKSKLQVNFFQCEYYKEFL